MKRRTPLPSLLWEPDFNGLERFVRCLNPEISETLILYRGTERETSHDFSPIRDEVRRLVLSWYQSGPNVTKFLGSEPVLAGDAARIQGHLFTDAWPRAFLILETQDSIDADDPIVAASKLFIYFLINPYNVELRGPCRRCDRYFVRKNQRMERIYCSRDCGHGATARKANELRRARERENHVAVAGASLLHFAKTRTALGWRDWVHHHTRLSKNLLTRMAKEGEISPPRHEKSPRKLKHRK